MQIKSDVVIEPGAFPPAQSPTTEEEALLREQEEAYIKQLQRDGVLGANEAESRLAQIREPYRFKIFRDAAKPVEDGPRSCEHKVRNWPRRGEKSPGPEADA